MTLRTLVFGTLLGFALALAPSCGGKSCDASSCASGCCDSAGTCQSGSTVLACGQGAQMCVACPLGYGCRLGTCVPFSNAGGGNGSGGGAGGGSGGGTGGGAGGGSGGGAGGGTGGSGGGSATTCPSGMFWTGGNQASASMDPGMACRACHLTSAPTLVYDFMGTVYSDSHVQDSCLADTPTGVQVEIIDATGNMTLSLSVNSAGNFYSPTNTGIALPYTARITHNGLTSTMTTPQTDGDCNTCHTAQGTNGAAGRIVWP